MPRIQQLPPQVFNKIAAGEVIERPASVVKELLENCVDAGAKRIVVEVDAGGCDRICITDDGCGIHPDDLELAVSCHATSKLQTADDLFRVRTFGFRGEALASIAEISRLVVRSRQADSPEGRELRVDLGRHHAPVPCGCPVGTRIEISDLFANTPVRRKYLKGVSTEFGHVADQFTRIAVAHPGLHLVLRHNGKLVYELPATANLLERISLFFGGEFADKLIPVDSLVGAVRLSGYVGHPSLAKSTRKGQYLFLNGRYIQDRSLQHALTEAYRGLLMVGRNPVSFLYLEMPPEEVDVNVHPTKSEVRFQDGQQLYRQMLAAIRTRFLSMKLDGELRLPGAAEGAPRQWDTASPDGEGGPDGLEGAGAPADRPPSEVRRELADWAMAQTSAWDRTEPSSAASAPGSSDEGRLWSPHAPPTGGAAPKWTTPEPRFAAGQPRRLPAEFTGAGASAAAFDNTTTATLDDAPSTATGSEVDASNVIGETQAHTALATDASRAEVVTATEPPAPARAMQIHDCYLVLETAEGLQVIDQHALHERILYEQLRERVLAGRIESQRLLIPQPVEVPPGEAALLGEHADVLGSLGLGIEEFGRGTVLVTRYPGMLSRTDPAKIVRDVVDLLATAGKNASRRDLIDSLLHMMSCKAAIKAGQRLAPEEIDTLLAHRDLVADAHHCPHGRPTALNLTRAELDRQFGRLG
jgi:DNA mismatch repair protein MutL